MSTEAALALGIGGFFASQLVLYIVTTLTDRVVLALGAGAVVGVFLPVGLTLWGRGLHPMRTLRLGPVGLREVGLALAVVGAAFAPTYALGAWSQRLFPPPPEAFALYEGLIPTSIAGLLLGGLVVIVLAPLAEEILFRGLILEGLGRVLPWGTAVAVQAFVFGVSHGVLWLLGPITILGVLLGLLRGRTGSLTPVWMAHGVYNGLAYTDLCRTHDVRSTRLERWALEPWVLLPSILALLVLGLWLGRPAGETAGHPGRGAGDDPLVTG